MVKFETEASKQNEQELLSMLTQGKLEADECRVVDLRFIYDDLQWGNIEHMQVIVTDASDAVISNICDVITADGTLRMRNAADAFVSILKTRGYKCEKINNVKMFTCYLSKE